MKIAISLLAWLRDFYGKHKPKNHHPWLRKTYYFLFALFRTRKVRINNFIIYTDPGDTVNLLQNREYEEGETNLFKKIIKPGWNVIDCGAHIGYHTLEFSRLVGKTGKVYAFEPAPITFYFLKKNIEVNRLSENVSCFNVAVSDKSGKSELVIADENGVPIGAAGYHLGSKGKKRITVDVAALDDVIYKLGQKINFIKIDVEGYEIKTLNGMNKILIDYNPILFIEYHPKMQSLACEKPENLLNYLLDKGYKLYDAKLKKETNKIELMKIYTEELNNHTNLLCTK